VTLVVYIGLQQQEESARRTNEKNQQEPATAVTTITTAMTTTTIYMTTPANQRKVLLGLAPLLGFCSYNLSHVVSQTQEGKF